MRPILLVSAVLAGCAVNAVSGRARWLTMTEADEVRLGAEADRLVRELHGVVPDGPLPRYVESLGQLLASIAPGPSFRYHFTVVDVEDPNAFAFPGGYIFVSRGLLMLLQSEEELAGVLAHEIGHVAAQHAAERQSSALPMSVLSRIITAPVGMVDEEAAAELQNSAEQLITAPHTRAQEREADRVAAAIVASLGHDPNAFANALARLGAARDALGHHPSGRLATHPPTEDRIELLRQFAGLLERGPKQPILPDEAAFLDLLDGLPGGPSLRLGRLVGQTLVWPESELAIDFPESFGTELTEAGPLGIEPHGRAFLQLLDLGADEDAAAETAARSLEGARLRLRTPISADDGRPISRGSATIGGEPPMLTRFYWFSSHGRLVQLAGHWNPKEDAAYEPLAEHMARSARRPSPSELGAIRIQRLRFVVTGEGETLAGIAAKVGGSSRDLALLNGLPAEVPVPAGVRLKVLLDEPL